MEIWIEIAESPGNFVSNFGRVIGRRGIIRKTAMAKGYRNVTLYDGSSPRRPRLFYVHRLVLLAFHGPPVGDRNQCNHKDTNKLNNEPHNLEWTTPRENVRHAHREVNFNYAKGSNHYRSKVVPVEEIIAARSGGSTHVSLTKEFSLGITTIKKILSGQHWSQR